MMSRRPAVLVAVLAAALPSLYAWTVRSMLRRNLRRLRAGDVRPLLDAYADDVRFVFPGRSSWAADLRGKDEVERWVRRFVRVGLRLEPHEILVAGPPWDTTVCLRFTDEATAPDGRLLQPRHDLRQDRLGQSYLLRGERGHPEGRRVRRVAGVARTDRCMRSLLTA